tara:strand:- start:1295 stop:2293 length:999 start_codon:yes stop_codon:yes gene_type:complete
MRNLLNLPEYGYDGPNWDRLKTILSFYSENTGKGKIKESLIAQIAMIGMIKDLEVKLRDGLGIKYYLPDKSFFINLKEEKVFYNNLYSIIRFIEEHNIVGNKDDLIIDGVYGVVHRDRDGLIYRLSARTLDMAQIEASLWAIYNAIAFEDKADLGDVEKNTLTRVLEEKQIIEEDLKGWIEHYNKLSDTLEKKNIEIADLYKKLEIMSQMESLFKKLSSDFSEGMTSIMNQKLSEMNKKLESIEKTPLALPDGDSEYEKRLLAAKGEHSDISKLIKKLEKEGQLTTKEIEKVLKCKINKRIDMIKILDSYGLISINRSVKPQIIVWKKPLDQ